MLLPVLSCIVDSAPRWQKLEILFVPLHRSFDFTGGLRCRPFLKEHSPYTAGRTRKAVYNVKCLCYATLSKQLETYSSKLYLSFLYYLIDAKGRGKKFLRQFQLLDIEKTMTCLIMNWSRNA
jgi:hypothetical protein